MTDQMIMSYIIQAWASSRPQIETDRQIRTCSCVFILSVMTFRWLFQQSAESNQTLKTYMTSVSSIIQGSIWTVTAWLCLIHQQMKCMSLYFSGMNLVSCHLTHQSHWVWVSASHWQLFSVDFFQTINVMSFTNPKHLISLWELTHCSSNSVL